MYNWIVLVLTCGSEISISDTHIRRYYVLLSLHFYFLRRMVVLKRTLGNDFHFHC